MKKFQNNMKKLSNKMNKFANKMKKFSKKAILSDRHFSKPAARRAGNAIPRPA